MKEMVKLIEVKTKLTQEQNEWLKNNYSKRSEGIRDCVQNAMEIQQNGEFYTQNDRKNIASAVSNIAEGINCISSQYPEISESNFNLITKGVHDLCQTLCQ